MGCYLMRSAFCLAEFPDDERFKLYKVYKKHKSTSALTFLFFTAK